MAQDGNGNSTEPPDGGTTTERGLPALVYQGQVIHERSEMLSLTDMWRGAKSPEDRRPSEWLRSADAQRFIEALGVMTDMGNSHTALVETKKGGAQQGTWAHWQIALAYAKYLSPEFHMWCNTVVRERMQGHSSALPADVLELIRRTDGIARQLSGKVTSMQAVIASLEEKNAAPTVDFAGTVSAYEIIEMAGIAKADRQRGTAQMVTNRMRDFCSQRVVAYLRTPAFVNPARPHRFPRELTNDWLLGESRGLELIRNQVDRAKAKKARNGRKGGQAAFHLVPPTSTVTP